MTFDTFDSEFDTLLGVYEGSSVGALTRVASNDDFEGGTTSKVTFLAMAGTTYHVAVDGRKESGVPAASGDFLLTWRPANDALLADFYTGAIDVSYYAGDYSDLGQTFTATEGTLDSASFYLKRYRKPHRHHVRAALGTLGVHPDRRSTRDIGGGSRFDSVRAPSLWRRRSILAIQSASRRDRSTRSRCTTG